MPAIDEYVKKLSELKTRSADEYNRAMNNYKTNYPAFYNQLVQAMGLVPKTKESKFQGVPGDYKWYLIAITGGIGVIIYLLFLLMAR
jgi:hypothetical protein